VTALQSQASHFVILVDTNVLYALADRRDKHHARSADWLQHTSAVDLDAVLIAALSRRPTRDLPDAALKASPRGTLITIVTSHLTYGVSVGS
jgi:predicted nucleic acid-binding protein